MKRSPSSEQLIRLAYAELVLDHAENDKPEEFLDKLGQDMAAQVETDDPQTEEARIQEDVEIDPLNRRQRIKNYLKVHKKLALVAGLALVFLIPMISLLILSNLRYQDEILPGTIYAGIELSSDSQKALEQIKDSSADYKFTLNFNDSKKSYLASDVGVVISPEDTLDLAKIQSNKVRFFARPFALFKTRQVEGSVELDQTKLKTFLETQNYADKLPQDAKIEFSPDQSKFVIIPEVAGRGIDSKSLSSKLEVSAKNLDTSTIDLNIEDVSPEIKQPDLEEPLSIANTFISQKITITSANKNYSPSSDVMKDWLILTPDPQNSTYNVATNDSKYKEYIDGIIKKVNRKMEKKLYASIDGSEMLLQEGTSGLQVSNADSARSQLASLFKDKKGGTISLDTKEEAPTTENVAASGGRWIFADISQFRIFAYEGAQLVNSFAMSSGKSSTPTPTGRYQIMSKVRVKTMTSGGNKNSRDYYSVPNIEWVAYFKSGGYAMHGVYWHNKFGVENTSHGCMGMSNASANWVYNFVDIGTPVIVVP